MIFKTFDPKNIPEMTRHVNDCFLQFFHDLGYRQFEEVPIISQKDHSVRFTGSVTNAFKPLLTKEEKIPSEGYYLRQKCLRTKNSKTFLDDSIFPKWGSDFVQIGALVRKDCLYDVSRDFYQFFTKQLEIETDRLCFHVSSSDEDFTEVVQSFNSPILFDKLNPILYKHKYGIDGYGGRNFNFAILNSKTEEAESIGNIVVIEKDSRMVCIEAGFGISVILSNYYNLENSMQASLFASIFAMSGGFQNKLADAISASVVMMRNAVDVDSSDHGRILRKYIQAISYLLPKANCSLDQVADYANQFEELEFGDVSYISDKLVFYLEDFKL